MSTSLDSSSLTSAQLTDAEHQLRTNWPERVLQFGTGALLRGLPDQIIDQANRQGLFGGKVVMVASTPSSRVAALQAQDHLFTHYIEGISEGVAQQEAHVNLSLSRALTARDDWEAVLACAQDPQMELILSNTTEVGIQYVEEDIFAIPPQSFPAKLTRYLYERFLALPESETVILPTELILDNGDKLKDMVLRHAARYEWGEAFSQWLQNTCTFANCLVDRIVTGSPSGEKATRLQGELGYIDEMLTVAEVYGLWAIEGAPALAEKLGFANQGLGAVVVEDITPFRERKLRILNGAHTISVALAHLVGIKTVEELMDDPDMGQFMRRVMLDEIVESLPDGISGGDVFSEEVMARFRNPYLHHKVLDITLQYTTKMNMRNALTFQRYAEKKGTFPRLMALGLAAFIRFAKPTTEEAGTFQGAWEGQPYALRDDQASWWAQQWATYEAQKPDAWVQAVLSELGPGGENLHQIAGLSAFVAACLGAFETQTPRDVLQNVLGKGDA